jgi:hypothetical protein
MKFLFSNHLIRASLAPQPPTLFKGVLELFDKLLKAVEILVSKCSTTAGIEFLEARIELKLCKFT